MAPIGFKVVIAGGGIVGLALGVMLERAGIDYLVLEAELQARPLGAVVYLGAPVLRAFEQLGLLEDLLRNSNILTGVTLLDHELCQIFRINSEFSRDRYGYETIAIVRPKLYEILLSRIPAYKILFGKTVVSTTQNGEGVKVRCQDGSIYGGDILVAADGGASPIRKAFYDEIRRSTKKVPHPSDYTRSKLDQRCVVGVTEPQSLRQYPMLGSKSQEMHLVMPKDSNCIIWFVPMAEMRFGWGITSPVLSPTDGATNSLVSNPLKRGKKNSGDLRDSLESGLDVPGSPASIHGMTQSFSGMSTGSYSPPSSASSSPSQPTYGEGAEYMGGLYSPSQSSYNESTTTSGTSVAYNSIKKRQSIGKLSKYSTSSTESQKAFQQYPSVLQFNETSSLDVRELPSDRSWGKLDEKFTIEDSVRDQPCPYGGTLGDLIDATSKKMITTVVAEEKFYHTWHYGRTILVGEACHCLLPSSGHSTTQGILDAISLASLLAELPSSSTTDVDALFLLHYERRAPSAKSAVLLSQQQTSLLFNRKLTGRIMRKLSSTWISDWVKLKMGDRLFESRPSLPFLKPVPDRGSYKNKDTTLPLLQDKRYEIARRKSVSSAYLSGATGSSKIGGGRGAGALGMSGVDSEFSSSMPSITMPPAVPALPMTRPMMDIEGTITPMVSRPVERRQHDVFGAHSSHWHLYHD